MEKQFDAIASKVTETIQSISSIYNEIGYTSLEIAEKKAEIFETINNAIVSFKSNLEREKNSINNECEWLRQQIRVILAMLNDHTGEKHLKLSSRGVVFDDELMYAEGAVAMGEASAASNQNHFMTNHSPTLSLLQYKTRLNLIFLEVLKAFVKVFKRFNEVNRMFWENIDTITDDFTAHKNSVFSESIPSKLDADEHAVLIAEFESILEQLNMTTRNYNPQLRQGMSETAVQDVAFIISSPRKKKQSMAGLESEIDPDASSDEAMNRLREINYKLVHAIRGLKVTKVTNETIAQLAKEVETTENEIEVRVQSMKDKISDCLNVIDVLSLTELDLIAIQRMQSQSDREKQASYAGEGLFDVDTLRFIQNNPREFGLMDHHLNFVARLTHTLQTIRDNKKKKWEQYSQVCSSLWEKLGENRSYTEIFLAENSNLTDLALTNLKMELKRPYAMRSEYVDSFILDARKQVFELHSKLLYSDARRQEFKYKNYDVNDISGDKECILDELEVEIEKLKRDYASKEPVLSLYAELNELLEDQNFLNESSKDSSRLLSKNSCKILLNEEKLRKKINKNLPRVLSSLKQEIITYNDRLLSEGLSPITAGNDDMFEKILLIESDLGTQGSKPTRNKPSVAFSTRTSSPKKPSLPEMNTIRRSPRAEDHKVLGKKTALGSAVLVPLNTSLAPNDICSAGPSPVSREDSSSSCTSSNDTLYSICSRVSPLKTALNVNRSFSDNFSPSKRADKGTEKGPISTEDEKENPFVARKTVFGGPLGALLKPKKSREDARLSSGSLANSTIGGDDYQTWRDERIKEINGEDLDLC
ncbi:hypothetical protein METBIDRAFT_80098 [Metschnikowia bicuspidata var. bicuspidata NRRL YB-4993]|uniref:Uncharacterized protein n=1 Tax=Metschnikowia bicuspidata var. bicuspidata NRRL YB-4993 TaxID=869754 RepID=A0A1A0H242_9ASCO|nr:hypothetical protein METBIDRAFT_80098 [Metschnikowia bicuspidata var. bicuspidata NRRL YB-4993]OBA17992.1 hypothetical protein METBIDRAFT_80098 [Metschnikowia bicuspidata var. bicuspidata NRRL YB-4993]